MNKLKRQVKTNTFNYIKYTIKHYAKLEQVLVLDEAFKSAYLDLEKVLTELNRKSESAKNALSLIYGNENFVYKLKDICQEIFEKLNSNLEVIAFNTPYYDKNLEPVDSVFASTRDDAPDNITFYNAFFEAKNEPLEDKGSIIIHEIAHLIGLKSDRETDSLKSAECIRNFLLLCTGKVTKDELFITEAEAKALKESGEIPEKIATRLGEHLYDPDQPRVEKGDPNGGQWKAKDGTNSGGSAKDEEEKNSNDSSDDKPEDSKNANNENKNNSEASTGNDKKAQNISNKGMSYSEPRAISSDSENKSTVTYKVNEEAGAVRASFTSADKSAEQNAGREDAEDKKKFIKDKPYTKDPSEAVLVNREYGEEKGLYANTTVRFDGFEPNKDYTIAIEAEYKYTDKDGKTQTENVLVFYDMKSDKGGTIIAERVTALACNDENMPIDEAEVTLNFYSLEGRVNYNFPNDSGYIQDVDNDTSNLNNPKNTNISQPLVSHAKTGTYDDNRNIQTDNQGGGVKDALVLSDDAISLFEVNIKSKR